MVGGYHEYHSIWHDPKKEVGNAHDPQAVAIKKFIDNNIEVVGHVLRRISSIC